MPSLSPTSYRRIILLLASIAAFMSTFDASMVNLALPAMSISLGVSIPSLIWIPTVYLVVIASLETTIGRVADVRGMKNLFIISIVIFSFGSLIASISSGLGELIVARVIQGLGAAGTDAAGVALLADVYPLERRGRAFGISQIMVYMGITTGPLIGGALVQTLGWRSIFYINIPIGLALMSLSIVFIKKEQIVQKLGQRFDVLGAICLTAFLLSLLGIFNDSELNLSSLESYVLDAVCIISLLAFIYVESRVAKSPLLDLRLFTQNRLFAAGISTSLMNYLTVYGTFFILSVYLQTVLGYSPVNAGLILLAQPAMMMLFAPIAGFLSEKISARFLSSFGMGLKAVAFFSLAFLNTRSPAGYIIIALAVIGIGHGFFSSPNVASVMGSVEHDKFGLASGALGTVRTSGQSIGIAMLGGIVASHMPAGSLFLNNANTVISGALAQDFVSGLSIAFFVASAISTIGVFTSLMRGKKVPQTLNV